MGDKTIDELVEILEQARPDNGVNITAIMLSGSKIGYDNTKPERAIKLLKSFATWKDRVSTKYEETQESSGTAYHILVKKASSMSEAKASIEINYFCSRPKKPKPKNPKISPEQIMQEHPEAAQIGRKAGYLVGLGDELFATYISFAFARIAHTFREFFKK